MARTLLLALVLSHSTGLTTFAAAAAQDPAYALERYFAVLEDRSAAAVGGQRLFNPNLLAELYAARAYAPLWIEDGPLAARLEELPEAIDAAAAHGLDTRSYHREALVALLRNPTPASADLELLASDAFLQQVRHRSMGAVSPRDLDPEWRIAEPDVDPVQTLRAAATSGQRLSLLLDSLWPASAEYRALVRHRARLLARGNAAPGTTAPAGVAVPATASLIDRIDANLERWRWLPRDQPDTYVRVNIAAFGLQVIRGGDEVLAMDVIVGLPYRRTPVFTAPITEIVINPYWNVPYRLAVQDKLPILKRDPGALAAQGFEVRPEDQATYVPVTDIDWQTVDRSSFHYLLRQRPGPLNALGQVKFLLPNPYAVYLHDTPSRELFDSSERTFSSGCIRLARALDLARWLLEHDGRAADAARLHALVDAGGTVTIPLRVPLPTQIVYFTAVSDASGDVGFPADVYGRDAALIAALRKGPAQ